MTAQWEVALDSAIGSSDQGFALLYRPGSGHPDVVDVVLGPVRPCSTLGDVPLRAQDRADDRNEAIEQLVAVPYRQIRERGFAANDDQRPVLVLDVHQQFRVPLVDLMEKLPSIRAELRDGAFLESDLEYADRVRRVICDEIGRGEGANFVIKRTFRAHIDDYTTQHVLSAWANLIRSEQGTHWTFLMHTPDLSLVGASPERHIALRAGELSMNPISGTYLHPASGASIDGLLSFLDDQKEANELYMVLDEELKIMGGLCNEAPTVRGPLLRQMSRLSHTEYFIEGPSHASPLDALANSMFAPTVTGGPVENACGVIQRHEATGRGYYSGCIALIGRDQDGQPLLDSVITIRTAEVCVDGQVDIGVGATLVRDSHPESEVSETRAKSAAIIAAISGAAPGTLADDSRVKAALAKRNNDLAGYWLGQRKRHRGLLGLDVAVVDAEDRFTTMLALILSSAGARVRVVDHRDPATTADVVVAGPGPGNPCDRFEPRIRSLEALLSRRLDEGSPTVAVCLSHQVLSRMLGLPLVRLATPNQGVARDIEHFGSTERVGFYNTYTAISDGAGFMTPFGHIEVARDRSNGQVHALRGAGIQSMQFHPESVLTTNGNELVVEVLRAVVEPSSADSFHPTAEEQRWTND